MATLEQLWTDRVAAATAAETAAASALADAAAALAGLRAARTAAGAALAAKAAEITAGRRALGEPGLSPAELAARVAALRALLVELRVLRRQALEADEAAALGEGDLEAARAEHGRRRSERAAAERELKAAEERRERLDRWDAALAAEPLSTLADRAAAAVDAAAEPLKPARERVEQDVPEPLRTRAIERYEEELARAELARTAAAEADALLAEELEPVSGEAAAAARALAEKEAALGDHVRNAENRVAAALSALKAIVESPPLTGAENAAITDADRVAAGEAALPAEKARDDARRKLAAKRAELEERKLELLAEDVDQDVAVHPEVEELAEQAAALASDLEDAEAALTAEMRADLDDWEAAVPDAAWDALLSFERARRRLTALAAADPDMLRAAVDGAEQVLVDALAADHKRRRTVEHLRGAAAANRRRNEVTQAVRDRRTLGAVRGDQ